MIRTHYDTLEVTEFASPEVIRGAYRYLSQKWHPDKNPERRDEAAGMCSAINVAYEVLSDPKLRKAYDGQIAAQRLAGKHTLSSRPARPAPSPPPPRPAPSPSPPQPPPRAASAAPTHGGEPVGVEWVVIWWWLAGIIAVRFWGAWAYGASPLMAMFKAIITLPVLVGVSWCVAAIGSGAIKQRLPRAISVLVVTTFSAFLLVYVARTTTPEHGQTNAVALTQHTQLPTQAAAPVEPPANSIAPDRVDPWLTRPVDQPDIPKPQPGELARFTTPGGEPDLSSLSADELNSIQTACAIQRSNGPASYNQCLEGQLAQLTPQNRSPDLSTLSADELKSIQAACALQRSNGPASYNTCLLGQLAQLTPQNRHPDLSSLSADELKSIQTACAIQRSNGPASYNQCLQGQLARLH